MMSGPTISSLCTQLAATEQQAAGLKAQIRVLRSQREILCAECSLVHHRICDLDLLCSHYYVSPSGCTDGDYWLEGDWYFLCPVSGVRNRLLFRDRRPYAERDRQGSASDHFKEMYRGLFKSRSDLYEDLRSSVNNTYIDDHREEFELPEKG